MDDSGKKIEDKKLQGDAEPDRVLVRSKRCPHGDKESLFVNVTEDEDAGHRTRLLSQRADDLALPLGEAPPYEFSEGKWLRSDLHTSELAPSCLDNLPQGAEAHRLGEPASRSSGEVSPQEDSQTIMTISEGTTDTFAKMPLEFVPLLCAHMRSADASESSGVSPAVCLVPVGVRSSGTFSVEEHAKGPEEHEPLLARPPAFVVFDDSTERSGGSPPGSGERTPAAEPVGEAESRVPDQDAVSRSTKGDTVEMQYGTMLREKVLTDSLIDQPGSRALPTPGFLSPREPVVPVLRPFKSAAAQTEKGPVVAYANCADTEQHNVVSRKLRTIPMRLFMLDLFAAFFLVVLVHYGLLSHIQLETKEAVSPSAPVEPPVCRSVLCRAMGTHLFYSLNLTARPCDSIYDVVCRAWAHSSPARYRRVVLGGDKLFVDNMHADVERVLISRWRPVSGNTSLDKLQRLYLLCTNAEVRDKEGLVTFQELIKRYGLDGWPFRPHHGNLVRHFALFVHDTGADVFFRLTSTPDGAEADVLTVECPSLGLPAESFTANTSDVRVYRAFIIDLLQRASGRVDVERIATEILKYETWLAHLVVAHCRSDDPYTVRSIDNSTVDMPVLISVAVDHHHQLQRNKIRLQSSRYLDGVTRLMQKRKASGTYFGWRVAAKLLPSTTTSMAKLYHQFRAELGAEFPTAGRQCLNAANDVMPLAVGRLLVSEYSRKAASFEAYRLLIHLVRSLDLEVYSDRWFDNETHGTYTRLRATMNTVFGYPPGLISDAMLDAYYDPVRDSQSYLAMYVSAATVTFQNSFDPSSALAFYGRERYIFLGDVLRWTERRSPRPFYDVRRNAFILPSGVLHPPYYDDDAVPALNYGGLGFIVAYDLLRGLLSNSTDTFWGRVVAKTNITGRYRCLESRIAQESPGVEPRGLAMAALAARLAFSAYHQREDVMDDKAVSGLVAMTPDQLFFVSVARTLCSVVREEHYVQVVLQRNAGGPLAQVDAALMWLPEFRDAFNCNTAQPPRHGPLLRNGEC